MANTINADNGVSSGSAGVKTSSDGTGILALQTNGTTAVTIDASQNTTLAGTLTIGTATQAVPSGTAPLYAARAWVNFNGTGTPAIRASGNVTSITDNNVGDYTINFTTAMPDANYSVVAMLRNTQTYAQIQVTAANITQSTAPTTSAVRINTSSQGDAATRANIDSDYVTAAIFR
jgi:hypothetical protein